MGEFDSLFGNTENEYSYYDDLQFIVDEDLRTIAIPSRGKIAGVRNDKDVNRIAIAIRKNYDGTDLSNFNAKINYLNAKSQPNYYMVTDKIVDEDYLILIWLVTYDVTAYKGEVLFSVQLFTANGGVIQQQFNTTIEKLYVLDGLQVEDYIQPVDKILLIEQLKRDTEALLDGYVTEKIEEIVEAGDEQIDRIEHAGAKLFVHSDTEANWNNQRLLIGQENHIYVYLDHSIVNNVPVPAIKIGNGNSYLIDQPFASPDTQTLLEHIWNTEIHITQEERTFWNNKVRSTFDQATPRTLILTKN